MQTRKRENYPDPATLPTSELVLGLARWDALGTAEHEPRLRQWLDECAVELDRRVPMRGEHLVLRCSVCRQAPWGSLDAGARCGRTTVVIGDGLGCTGRIERWVRPDARGELPTFLFANHQPEHEHEHGPDCLFCSARRENDRQRSEDPR